MLTVAAATPAGEENGTNGVNKQTQPPTRMNKYNPLPTLGRRTASRARLIPSTSTGNHSDAQIKDEETMTTVVHSQVTQRLPISGALSKNLPAAVRTVGKSLPRLGGNLKRLDKLNFKGKGLGTEEDGREESYNPSPTHIEGEIGGNHSVNGIILKHFAKTMPGYSEGKTKTNQDAIYVNLSIKDATNSAIFAVFDGHGTLGHRVSDFLKDKLTGSITLTTRSHRVKI